MKKYLLKNILNEIRGIVNEDDIENQLKSILKKDYVTFVKQLGDNIKDPKFIAAIKSLSNESPIRTSSLTPVCTDLRPTQNEVVLDKSLSYPLKQADTCNTYLKGGIVTVDNRPIVTGGGGKFVIDGHHRWSQLYCINPDAKITSMDLSDITKPLEALKATQLGIGAELGKIPTSKGGGINLFTINEKTLKTYVKENIQEDVIAVFEKHGKGSNADEVADYIWGNVTQMQDDNEPVDGAPKRKFMPQTDDAPNWKDTATNTEKIPETVGMKLKDLLAYKK